MKNKRICIYYRIPPEKDRWFIGDRFVRKMVRYILRGPSRPSGIEKVYINLCKAFDRTGVHYFKNIPFNKLLPSDRIIVLGGGKYSLEGYTSNNKIIAGIGLMTHPSEWPDLLSQYPVEKYLQHSEWANNIYKPYFKEKCDIWPVGIDTENWTSDNSEKSIDVLIYNKIHWDYDVVYQSIIEPIKNHLISKGLTFKEIRYGKYHSKDFKNLLNKSKSMYFFCEHESQGIAYQECLSMNVPIFAWDLGVLKDPNYKLWGDADKPTTSVPYWDSRCGLKFKNIEEFYNKFDQFHNYINWGKFSPRTYVIENLSLEKSAQKILNIIEEVYK